MTFSGVDQLTVEPTKRCSRLQLRRKRSTIGPVFPYPGQSSGVGPRGRGNKVPIVVSVTPPPGQVRFCPVYYVACIRIAIMRRPTVGDGAAAHGKGRWGRSGCGDYRAAVAVPDVFGPPI